MEVVVITYSQIEHRFSDVKYFMFRTNQVSNWIKIKKNCGEEVIIHDICAIETLDETNI